MTNLTEKQNKAFEEAEKYLRSQTSSACRSNKKLIGLENALYAVRQCYGMFAEYAKDKDVQQPIANDFFKAFEEGDLNYVLTNYARNWR